MYYKEWSTDTFWLPETGLSLLPSGDLLIYIHTCLMLYTLIFISENPIPKQSPKVFHPCFDADVLKKLETTIKKVSAYLERADAASWWETWLKEAQQNVTPSEPHELDGNYAIYINIQIYLI